MKDTKEEKVKFYICDACEGGCNGGYYYSREELRAYFGFSATDNIDNVNLNNFINNSKPGEDFNNWGFPLIFCLYAN